MLVILRVKGLIYPSVTQTFTVLEPRLLTWIDFFFPDPGHCLNKLFLLTLADKTSDILFIELQ